MAQIACDCIECKYYDDETKTCTKDYVYIRSDHVCEDYEED